MAGQAEVDSFHKEYRPVELIIYTYFRTHARREMFMPHPKHKTNIYV